MEPEANDGSVGMALDSGAGDSGSGGRVAAKVVDGDLVRVTVIAYWALACCIALHIPPPWAW